MDSRFQFFVYSALLVIVGAMIGVMFVQSMEQMEQKAPLAEGSYFSKVHVVAVSNSGSGVISEAEVEIREGKGRVFFSVNPFVEPDTQFSAETAKKVAEAFTGKSTENKDISYSIEAGETRFIGGPSVGAALALATIAAIEKKELREDVAITGTIYENGSIGQIGRVMEKATAASRNNIKIFLVPPGQSRAVFYEKKTEEKQGSGFVFERVYYEPVEFDLNRAFSEEYGMGIIEVGSIGEAAAIAFK